MLNSRRCQPQCNSPQDFQIHFIGVIEPWYVNKDKAPRIPRLVWEEIVEERVGGSARFKIVVPFPGTGVVEL